VRSRRCTGATEVPRSEKSLAPARRRCFLRGRRAREGVGAASTDAGDGHVRAASSVARRAIARSRGADARRERAKAAVPFPAWEKTLRCRTVARPAGGQYVALADPFALSARTTLGATAAALARKPRRARCEGRHGRAKASRVATRGLSWRSRDRSQATSARRVRTHPSTTAVIRDAYAPCGHS
jgi:hypothetical protein